MALLVCILSCLPERMKDQITVYVDYRQLDRALHRMIMADIFPDWFSRGFSYDSLHCFLGGLRDALSLAVSSDFIQYDGTYFDYHIMVDARVRRFLLRRISVSEESVMQWADDLGNRLRL
ncbi:MAG: hypothetical protein KGJ13_00465 [Patescibacteria group bacterium]|nr:hypothetical protein [Patescibacteria group bacterium]